MSFFSVVIPLYNKEKYVENALKSILNQTFTDYEVLIINDSSTDKSVEKVIPFLSEKIKLIHHSENKGLSASRNTGIEKATTNYITFLDADDLWKPTFLETIHRLIINFPEARIFGTNYEEVYQNKTYQPHNGSDTLPKNFEGYINFFKINVKQGIYNHGSVCVAKEVYEKVGNYDETIDFAEDLDFNIRANFNFKLAYSNCVGMSYFMNRGIQITTSSIIGKSVPDYRKFEKFEIKNPEIKKYLDFERYVLAKHLKVDGAENYKEIINQIDFKNLNYKQKILLILPKNILKFISNFKMKMIQKGIKISTYSN